MSLFSWRNRAVPDTYSYEIPEKARVRILHTLRDSVSDCRGVFDEVEKALYRLNGKVYQNHRRFIDDPSMAMFDHFMLAPAEEAMDFLQLCFETESHAGGQRVVDGINEILEQENTGYELTAFRKVEVASNSYRIIPPIVLKKDEKLLHSEVVRPCLYVLSDRRFNTASQELLKAFEEYREGEYGDAITDAGAAFETVLKTICTYKNWTFDKDKDTCSKLLEVCRANGLFHPFYKQILEGVATIRNKVGDAHGKGPKPEFVATKELADHMLYTVCTNTHLLITLAQL